MIDFLFIYEHKVRELDNLCLLRATLELRGYSVAILNRFDFRLHNYFTGKRKPKVVAIAAAYGDASLFAQAYQFCGVVRKVINFRWEQVFAQQEEKNGAASFHSPKGTARQIVHLCWGEIPYRQLKRANVDHAFITGPLQLDFLAPQLRRLYKTREEMDKEYALNTKRVFLYISSFAYASYGDEEIRHYEKLTGNKLQENALMQRANQLETIAWFERVLDAFEDATVVYRPHPAEKMSGPVAALAEKNTRFRVISDESVKQWILVADHISTWASTSVVEAYYAGKNVTILRPCEMPALSNPTIYEGCRYCAEYEDFVGTLTGRKEDFPIDTTLLGGYYDEDFRNLSCQRTADLFERVYRSSEFDYIEKRRMGLKIAKSRVSALCKRFVDKGRRRVLVEKIWPFTKLRYAMHEYDQYAKEIVPQEEIARRVEEIKNALR